MDVKKKFVKMISIIPENGIITNEIFDIEVVKTRFKIMSYYYTFAYSTKEMKFASGNI